MRSEIDEIDNQLIALIKDRIRIAQEIAQEKERLGSDCNSPAREEEVLSRVGAQAAWPLVSESDLQLIFERIVGVTRKNAKNA